MFGAAFKQRARHQLSTDTLNGVRVGILGVGAVGMPLAENLNKEGASLVVADVNEQATQEAANLYGATIVGIDAII